MPKKTPIAKKVLSLAICIIFVLGLIFALSGGMAEAKQSLANIERIKKQGGSFRILEILPDGSEGSIGYLIAGQEPIGDWTKTAANLGSPQKRKDYVNGYKDVNDKHVKGLFENLGDAGLLGTDDTAPLENLGTYVEFFPWTKPEGATPLELDNPETANVNKGSFTYTPDGDGAYEFTGGYELDSPLIGNPKGTHIQNIAYFTAETDSGKGYYWYKLTFTAINDWSKVSLGTAIYENNGKNYAYTGTYGLDFESPLSGAGYYTAAPDGAPSESKTTSKPYAAVADGFIPVEQGQTGYFKQEPSSYHYVEFGGDYNYNAAGSGNHFISYNTVYYTGGIKNNEWFLRHVLDWDEGEERPRTALSVSSISATDLTTELIEAASLIVISNGLALGEDIAEIYSGDRDINDEVSEKLEELCSQDIDPLGRPIIIDKALLTGELKINELANELCKGKTEAHVSNNVYCAQYPLVNSSFIGKLNSQAFSQVLEQIDYENYLRGLGGTEETVYLSNEITPAKALRHIIAGQKGQEIKNTIKVLEIQAGKTGEISVEAVRSWLGADSSLEVNITTQSVSELIGKIEPIYQTYDLVYIGSCTKDLKTATINGELITSYDDASMNGLIYTNIGDTVRAGGESGFSLSGLLDRDYNSTVEFSHSGDRYNALKTGYNQLNNLEEKTRTFRLSGNDLTRQKFQELISYANSGYPIVVANDLYSSITIDESKDWRLEGNCNWGVFSDCRFNISLEVLRTGFGLSAALTKEGLQSLESHKISRANFRWYKYNEDAEHELIKEDLNVKIAEYDRAVSYLRLDGNEGNLGEGMYYCEVEGIEVKAGYWEESEKPARSNIITVKSGVLNENRVDNSSVMCELLKDIEGKRNVMSVWQTSIGDKPKILNRSTNLQKPEIVFAVSGGKDCLPEPYTGLNGESLSPIDQGSPKSVYELSFRFHLKIDPNLQAETYQCYLYTDLNGDGRYTEDERLNNLTIREWNMETQSAGDEVSENNLQTGKEYIINRRLPSDMLGIIPWKLEFEKVNLKPEDDFPRINCYQTGYTHIKPQPEQIETINILQINNKNNIGTDMINLEKDLTFQRLFDNVRGEFDINLMTVGAQELDGLLGKYEPYLTDLSRTPQGNDSELLIEYLRANVDFDNNIVRYSGLPELLNSFDMLVLGFGDSYQGISWESARAITDFIKTGKATLFSHDCSSFFFLPFKEYQTENEQFKFVNLFRTPDFVYSKTNFAPTANFTMFGYEFNMAIRDAVGLDRYGVTNPIFGITQYAPKWLKKDLPDERIGIVASDKYTITGLSESRTIGGLTQEVSKHLQDAGYSIAYEPKSEKKKTVPETQGLSSGVLMRYYKSGGKPTVYDNPSSSKENHEKVTQITQVNSGQITSYPYDINTQDFGGTAGTGNRITIIKTHSQYQQLNLNSDDVVVWYCLAGGSFDNSPNDVINNYYLYSRGNVTYTGFGHTEKNENIADKIAENDTEAKLFVNTMIAAYRAAKSELQIKFTDESGEKDITNFLMPSDNGKVLKIGGNSDKTRRIFFTISDLSEVENQTLSVSFSDGGNDETQLSGLDIYDASSQKPVSENIGLVTGKTYYIKLDDVLEKIGDEALEKMGVGGISLNAEARSMSAGNAEVSSDTLMLRKLNLLNLY
ncbi:MAG: DUF5057 domain-containing protein [Clostridiales bacterium]|nr:DUF5057 domain-containing protein [Clostridiales bacterium]